MKILMTLAVLAGCAASAFGQSSNENRQNHQMPEGKVAALSAENGDSFANENRMNVWYTWSTKTTSKEFTGGPNPYGNRLNNPWPTAKTEPKPEKPEKKELQGIPDPYPRP
jgi:hypothetical protein